MIYFLLIIGLYALAHLPVFAFIYLADRKYDYNV